jgi:hypothetical protein
MSFVTKLDYSDNRQIKQFELTNTQLSGTTEFGVAFSALTGVLDSSIVLTATLTGITSTFSGNSTTTNVTFGDPRMVSGSEMLEVITDITSGTTQQGYGFLGVDPYELDGNTIYGSYTGSSYDFSVTSIEEVGVDIWTGETISNMVSILSGSSTDFTGRTIWVDVLGIARTERLILTDEPDEYSGATHVLTRGLSGDVVNFPISAITHTLTGHTHVIADITDFTDNSTNWNAAYYDSITGMTVTGTTTKTITLFQQDGGLVQASFTDEVGVGAGNDYLTGATFNTTTGDLTLSLFSGSTVIENLDGRYSLTGHTHTEFGDYLPLSGGTLTGPVTGTTFNVNKSQLDYQENLTVDSGTTETIATVSIVEYKAVFFDYVVSESTNIRAGTVMTTHMGGSTVFTDNSTTDIGDTSDVIFSTDISGSDLRLLATTATDGWEIKVMIRAL